MNRSLLILLILVLLITSLTVNWGRTLQACRASGDVTGTYLSDANDPNEPEPDPNSTEPQPETAFIGSQIR
jgi:hypothetical protein